MPLFYKKSSYAETPSDAVIISRSDAAQRVWEAAEKLDYPNGWVIKGSVAFMSLYTGVSSVYLINKIRKLFKVGRFGYFTTAVPAAYVPIIVNYLSYRYIISTPIMLQENVCPVCLQVRTMAMQAGLGVAYPFFIGYYCTYSTASGVGTIVAPPVSAIRSALGRKEMFAIFKRTTSKLVTPLSVIAISQMTIASLVVMLQAYKIDDILDAIEQKRRDDIDKIYNLEKEKAYRQQRYSVVSVTA